MGASFKFAYYHGGQGYDRHNYEKEYTDLDRLSPAFQLSSMALEVQSASHTKVVLVTLDSDR